MQEGFIRKALSGYYYVSPKNDLTQTVQCRARGLFKLKGVTPLVGDVVRFETTSHGEGIIYEIVLPRTSELIRPPVANVELAVLVFSLLHPELNVALLDKFLVHTEFANLETVICLSKQDLIAEGSAFTHEDQRALDALIATYSQIGYKVIMTSAVTGRGIEELLDCLAGKIAVFAGQSGVGKSSLLNAMVPGLQLETREISMKLGRGKHTTRHVELIPLDNGGIVADTPGFSQLDFSGIEAEDLGSCFKEFRAYAEQCKFRGCLHQHEPDCAVIAAKDRGEIRESRYEHYVAFLTEIKEKKRRY